MARSSANPTRGLNVCSDPVADVAVLGSPDNQALWEEAEGYERRAGKARPLPIADAPTEGSAYVLSLDGQWIGCTAKHCGGSIWLEAVRGGVQSAMSGSPIVNGSGAAIGVVCLSERAPNPRLTHDLPAEILRKITKARVRSAAEPALTAA